MVAASTRATLKYHFPNARLIDHHSADERILSYLTSHPRCLEFRKTNHLSPKLFDFPAYLESDRPHQRSLHPC